MGKLVRDYPLNTGTHLRHEKCRRPPDDESARSNKWTELQRGTVFKGALDFLADWIIGHWPAALLFIFGGGALSLAGAMTDWLRSWGPVLWVLLFFLGSFVGLLLYAIFVWVSRQEIENRFAKMSVNDGAVNVLEGIFDKKDIQIHRFFNPYYSPNNSKRFTSCRIVGPAMVVMMKETNIVNCRLNDIQIVIARPGKIVGGIAFTNTTFF